MPETHEEFSRRQFVAKVGAAAVAMTGPILAEQAEKHSNAQKPQELEVTATEDLMREHGVLRRALLVYRETVPRLRQDASKIDPRALHQTADLFRVFGEEYHEKMLEEQHIFPIVRKMKAEAAKYPDVLIVQHERGRKITDYILAVTNFPSIAPGNAEPLARAFESMVRMYQHHAAREDTIVFPAWKENFTQKQIDEFGDQFEEIEQKMFGKDGFEDAERKIGQIEQTLGLADIAQFTAPAPPKIIELPLVG
jgi:hemerythrin-like domain-containing protein